VYHSTLGLRVIKKKKAEEELWLGLRMVVRERNEVYENICPWVAGEGFNRGEYL